MEEVKTIFRGPGEWRSQAAKLEAPTTPPDDDPGELAVSGVEEFVRSHKAQMARRRSAKSIGARDPSLRWPHLYDILRSKGYDKEKAARISNSRLRFRKKGRLHGLPWQQADNPGALKKVRQEQERKKSRTASALVAACYEKSCAPPPTGAGGSNPGKSKGWTKASWGGQWDKGDYTITHASGIGLGPSYSVFHKGKEKNDEYRAMVGGRPAKNLGSPSKLEEAKQLADAHAAAG